jgi:hypothetical protein
VFQVLGKLNKDLNKIHGSIKQSLDLLKVEYTPTDTQTGADLSKETQGPDFLSGL